MSIFGVRKYSGATERFVINNINKIKTELDNATQVYKRDFETKLQSTDILFYKYTGDRSQNIRIVKQGQSEITQIYYKTLHSYVPFSEENYLSLFQTKIQDIGEKLKISADKMSIIANEPCLIKFSVYLDLHIEKMEAKQVTLKFYVKTNRVRTDTEISCNVTAEENKNYNINMHGALFLNNGDSLRLACESHLGELTFNFTSHSRFIAYV